MATESNSQVSRWRRGQRAPEWTADEQPFAVLLETLADELAETESTRLQLEATSRRGMADVLEEGQLLEQDQHAEARRELELFRSALCDAFEQAGPGGAGEVAYDSAWPEPDERASVLIHYLVRTGYAEVRTEERDSGHPCYYLRIDWPRLRDLASRHGQRVPW